MIGGGKYTPAFEHFSVRFVLLAADHVSRQMTKFMGKGIEKPVLQIFELASPALQLNVNTLLHSSTMIFSASSILA